MSEGGDPSARDIISELELERHPEGGWYRECWRSEVVIGGDGEMAKRASATAIYFLLEAGEQSAWHRVDACEIWLWHAGVPLDLWIRRDLAGETRTIRLGPDLLAEQRPQGIVPAGHWQAAAPVVDEGRWSLVSCIVSPGFEFSGFELAE
jgi:predicted cupin superfamily sugar epimerase